MSAWRSGGRRAKLCLMAALRLAGDPPPAGQPWRRVLYGLTQPVVGARALIHDRALLRSALMPVALLAAFCAVLSLTELSGGAGPMLRSFYRTFALLAPLPSVLMAGHYARMVVQARSTFAFAPAPPRREPILLAVRRAVVQAILIATALIPAMMVFRLLGHHLVKAVAALWALHWIVVDAFDASRVDRPELPPARLPWFARALERASRPIPVLGGLVGGFARFCGRLARPWHEELEVIEAHPTLAIGFAAATAVLLATPVLNLFFRPIVIIGAVHVLGRLEEKALTLEATAPQRRLESGRPGDQRDEDRTLDAELARPPGLRP
jgi:hypothetical protein